MKFKNKFLFGIIYFILWIMVYDFGNDWWLYLTAIMITLVGLHGFEHAWEEKHKDTDWSGYR